MHPSHASFSAGRRALRLFLAVSIMILAAGMLWMHQVHATPSAPTATASLYSATTYEGYAVAADPDGNIYSFAGTTSGGCAVHKIAPSDPSNPTLLPGTNTTWCHTSSTFSMVFANVAGTPELLFADFTANMIFRYTLPDNGSAAPQAVAAAIPSSGPAGLAYDAASDTLYASGWNGSTTTGIMEVPNFSGCTGSCTAQSIPGLPPVHAAYPSGLALRDGWLFTTQYVVPNIMAIQLTSNSPTWQLLPLPPASQCAQSQELSNNYPDQMTVDPSGNIYFTCNEADELFVIPSGSQTVEQVTVNGATFDTYTPYGLTYLDGSIYTNGVIGGSADGVYRLELAPLAPTQVGASVTANAATISWTAPPGTISSYTVTMSPGGATCTVTVTQCSFNGLSPSTTYSVTVTATNDTGTSPASTAFSFTTEAPATTTSTSATTTTGATVPLAVTGFNLDWLLIVALGTLGGGLTALAINRRKRAGA